MRETDVNGVRLCWQEEGSGRPVLFIHGGFGGVESTLYPKPSVVSGVLPGFRTISFDRRNSGRSAYVLQPTRLEDLAADARGLLAVLDVERCIVVGDSLGGLIALQLGLDHPDVVEGLVLMETSAFILPRPPRVQAVIQAMRLLGPRLLYRVFRRRFLEPNWSRPLGPAQDAETQEAAAAHRLELRRRLRELPDSELYRYSLGLIRTYVAFSGRDLRPDAGRIEAPIRVLHGLADKIVSPRHGRELTDLIPAARLTELPGLGHGLLYYPDGREALQKAVRDLAGEAGWLNAEGAACCALC